VSGSGAGRASHSARAGPAGGGPSGGAVLFYSTLTLRFDPASGSFDDARFDEFAKSKELLGVKEHFFTHGGLPHLLLCVSWRMPPAGSARKVATDDEAWKGLLTTPEAQERFDRLRR
jgi:hypothetical protein